MKRLWWLLRLAFHDWMWEGGASPDRPRALARKLPLYFSDPWDDDRGWESVHPVEVGVRGTTVVHIGAGAKEWIRPETTTTYGAGTTTTYRYTS